MTEGREKYVGNKNKRRPSNLCTGLEVGSNPEEIRANHSSLEGATIGRNMRERNSN